MSFEDDIYRVADSIEALINNAIDSRDFQKLSQNISDRVNSFVSSDQYKRRQPQNYTDPLRNSYTRQTIHTVNQQMWPAQRQILNRQRYKAVGDRSFTSTIRKIAGGFLLGTFGVGAIALIPELFQGYDAAPAAAAIALCGGLAVLGVNLIRRGRKTSKRLKLFKKIQNVIGTREYIDIAELAERVDMDRQALLKELNAMLSDGLFLHGHLDKTNTCLMVTDEVYDQYLQLEHQQAQLRQEAEEKERIQRESGLTPEYYEMLSSCASYIEKIHQCNIDLPGVEITKKLDRLELVIQRILDEARKNPKKTRELHKFMDYYMPTTWKLLDAYRTFEQEPIQSENIVNTKKEIEKSLDTINEAYEKLLNDLFQTTAWDITSDISVLNTMLAQEGLTGNAFEKMRSQASQAPSGQPQAASAAQTAKEPEGFTVSNGQTTLRF